MSDKGFKLIAIVPLEGCSKKLRKNLQFGTVYKFYQNYYVALNKKKSSIVNVKKIRNDNDTDYLYKLKNGINVNISAVVGENGSGKSALIELYYYFIYALSVLDNNIKSKSQSENESNRIKYLKEQYDRIIIKGKLTDYINFQKIFNLNVNNVKSSSDYKEQIQKSYNSKIKYLETIFENTKSQDLEIFGNLIVNNLVLDKLNLSVIYETNSVINVLSIKEGKISFSKANSDGNLVDDDFHIQKFCYAISLNYSHHSLNSLSIGTWINSLFHKNDGYSTPVVINPMRENGNYNINRELHLSNERLMFNLAYNLIKRSNQKKEYKLLNKYTINSIQIKLKENIGSLTNFEPTMDFIRRQSCYFLLENTLENSPLNINDIEILEGLLFYLNDKIERIKERYGHIIFTSKHERNEALKEFIQSDKSHITKKVRQLLNYFSYLNSFDDLLRGDAVSQSLKNPLPSSKDCSYSIDNTIFINFLTNNARINNIDIENCTVLEFLDILPPSIYEVNFNLNSIDENSSFPLTQLSSGEQQMIFNVNTILYHLYNLQSVHLTDQDRVKYKNVSIILDEIELYYHPEMQRQFVSSLLDSLELLKIKGQEAIKNLNILFLTHSPFILSDIPSANILLLENGLPYSTNKESFGANIYSLLKDSFFLKNGFQGEYSSHIIRKLYLELNYLKYKSIKYPTQLEINITEQIEKEYNQIFEQKIPLNLQRKRKEFKHLISIIGETLLKDELNNLYLSVFSYDEEYKKILLEEFRKKLGLKASDND